MLLWLIAIIGIANAACSWDSCNAFSNDPSVMNVHLVTHTHDDLGWLITVDQYYDREVQYIYDSVVTEVQKNPSYKFSFAETGYLMRWVESRNSSMVQQLVNLVQNGQIELIGGGWVQNDEAASHYVDIIDQMTLGFEHLSLLFGTCGAPKAAWQIDPFGHSREFANLVTQMGMDSLWFARLHYLDRSQRHMQKNTILNWIGSNEQKTSILTGAFYNHYSPPNGFCFDKNCNDPEITSGNVAERAAQFADEVKDQGQHYSTNHVLLTMGDDFEYTDANKWFRNLDKLIAYFDSNPAYKMKLVYSTPSCYAQAVRSAAPILKPKTDDFFPYASGDHSFWTGYFTSRPTFKGMIRQASSYMNLAKQISGNFVYQSTLLEGIKRASGLVQHHDAVTGTAKQVVTYDYAQRLDEAQRYIEDYINHALQSVAKQTSPAWHKFCFLTNETVCNVIQSSTNFSVAVFNPVGRHVSSFVRVPLYKPSATVYDSQFNPIRAQIVPKIPVSSFATVNSAPYDLYIPVEVDALGIQSYLVATSSSNSRAKRSLSENTVFVEEEVKNLAGSPVSIENDILRLQFDGNGYLASVFDKRTNVRRNLRQEFLYYESMGNNGQPSGAYVFRPASQTAKTISTSVSVTTTNGLIIQEVRQQVAPWVYQVIRLHKGQAYIEFDWIIGPIPKEASNPIGKEIITRYTTDIQSNGIFYTDSSGRQLLKRTWDSYPTFQYEDTEPISGNYYPVTNKIYTADKTSQLTILTDRSQGGTSNNGMIELMLHRRCFHDDHFGVSENLDEPGLDGKGLVARGQHWVLIGDAATAASVHRPLSVNLFHRPVPVFADLSNFTPGWNALQMQFTGLTSDLPQNVNLLTLEYRGNHVLLRLEHIFQSGEDSSLSQPATIDFKNLFAGFGISKVQELTLGGNKDNGGVVGTQITLQPQQIRTFALTIIKRQIRKSE